MTRLDRPMRICIVTDAWWPQVNGVVRTLTEVRRELEALGHAVLMITPERFPTLPCPTYPEIRLSLAASHEVASLIDGFGPDALHIATEGPLGWAARQQAIRRGLVFTTAFHTRFPEYIQSRFGLPLSYSYAFMRKFHGRAERVMVATPTLKRELEAAGLRNLVLWSRGVDVTLFTPEAANAHPSPYAGIAGPVFLYVGRVAVEKNLEAFLALDLPGSKWVVGEGPAMNELKRRYPATRFVGMVGHAELPRYYAHANAFVFPSKTDTFGLVLLEALACGLPVAGYPVAGPIDVVGGSGAGALNEDLRKACLAALEVARATARAHALTFSWAEVARHFVGHLRPLTAAVPLSYPNAASPAA
jgi:glycosyltransferase involved in cell wall biosynthesis